MNGLYHDKNRMNNMITQAAFRLNFNQNCNRVFHGSLFLILLFLLRCKMTRHHSLCYSFLFFIHIYSFYIDKAVMEREKDLKTSQNRIH